MEHIRKAFERIKENWVLLVPAYVTRLIPALISIYIFSEMSGELLSVLSTEEIGETQNLLENYQQVTNDFFEANREYIMASILVTVLGILMNLIAMPAIFGMVKQNLENGEKLQLSDILSNAGRYFLKYLLYSIGKLGLWIFVLLMGALTVGIVAYIGSLVDSGLAVLLVMLLGLGFILVAIALHIIIKLWFPAMVLEGIGVFEGLKEAFRKGKICFWPLFAGFLGVMAAGWIANMLVGIFIGDILLLDAFLIHIIPSFVTVTLIIFYFLVYQESKKELVNSREEG